MKRYYVHYYRDFANTYNLYWAETTTQIEKAEKKGCERITRKEAEILCAAENDRCKHDSNFSGYASSVILPVDYEGYWQYDKSVYKDGYIILYKE